MGDLESEYNSPFRSTLPFQFQFRESDTEAEMDKNS